VLRKAAALADPRAESPWETLLRVLHEVSGVPVVPQYELYDRSRFVARGDLWLEGTRVFHEYDGGDHLLRAQQRKDLRRARAMSDSGWVRRGYTAVEVVQQAHVIVRDADLSLGRPHRPERVRPWYALLAESLFTPRGTARVLRRWRIRA
jgi:very-short-patch-repair endonuclease